MFGTVEADKSKYDLETGIYIVKPIKLEPAEGQFGPSIKWYLEVAHRGDPPTPVSTDTGERYELWQFTDAVLSPSNKAGKWATAFLGRPIKVGEDGAEIAAALIGKKAIASIGPNPKSGRIGILELQPYSDARAKGQAVAAATAAAANGSEDDEF